MENCMDRRTLLKLISGVSVLPLLPNTSLASTSGKRVILLELAGANDGLNTVVPYSDDRYHELRPNIGLKGKDVISLDDTFGFHYGLKSLMPLWESNEMAVIPGLGYPNPNRSHFKSIALWETGSDGVQRPRHNGWVTHDIEHAYAVSNIDAHGISLGGGMGVFHSLQGNWLSMETANQFSNRAIDLASGSGNNNNPMMEQLLESAATLRTSIDRIAMKVENNNHPVRVQGSGSFNAQIAHVINLINAGVDVPVLKITLAGFDTHEGQLYRHKALMKNLATGVSRLKTELSATDNWHNTVIITYSEFGRRAAENRSNGTDHGTAAPHFVFGGQLNGGFHGEHPDLSKLQNNDLQFTMDYRALYSSVLSDWLQLPGNAFAQHHNDALTTLFS